MKTILVDAVHCLILNGEGMNQSLYDLLEQYQNKKIVLTGANDEELVHHGIIDLPYPFFTMKHHPNKSDPVYYQTTLRHFNLTPEDVIYFEHDEDAVKSARSVGITTYHYDNDKRNLVALKNFLDNNL